jgi:hypothetical protein
MTTNRAKTLDPGTLCADHSCMQPMSTSLDVAPLRLSVRTPSSGEQSRDLELEWHRVDRRLRLVDQFDRRFVIREAIAPELRLASGAIEWNDQWLVVSGLEDACQRAEAFFASVQADLQAPRPPVARRRLAVGADPTEGPKDEGAATSSTGFWRLDRVGSPVSKQQSVRPRGKRVGAARVVAGSATAPAATGPQRAALQSSRPAHAAIGHPLRFGVSVVPVPRVRDHPHADAPRRHDRRHRLSKRAVASIVVGVVCAVIALVVVIDRTNASRGSNELPEESPARQNVVDSP